MKGEGTPRQVRALAFSALLAPMAALPALLAREVGGLGWLVPLLLIPGGLLALRMLRALGHEGLGHTLTAQWGKLGKLIAVLWYLWLMALAGLEMGVCADRLCRTDYSGASPWVISLAVTGVGWYLTLHGRVPLLRAAQVLVLLFTGVLTLLAILCLGRLEPGALLPGEEFSVSGLLGSLIPAAGTLSVGSVAALPPRTPPEGKEGRWAPAVWCLVWAGLCALVIGTLGAALAAQLPLPFFLAMQGMEVSGGFRRLEALGTAVWALSDLALLSMTALAGETLAGDRKGGRWPILAAGLLGGGLLTARRIAPFRQAVWGAGLLFGVGIPLLLLLTKKRTGKNRGPGTSCG